MINKLNYFLLKVFYLNKFFKNFRNLFFNNSKFFDNSFSKNIKIFRNFYIFSNFYKNFNFLIKFNFLILFNFLFSSLFNFLFVLNTIKNKKIKYEKIYKNIFKKHNFILNSYFYNVNAKNKLYFYKFFNSLYIKKSVKEFNPYKYKYNKLKFIKKISFFKFKKNKDYINHSFLNSYNFFKNKSVKKINLMFCKKNLFNNFFFIDSVYFNKNSTLLNSFFLKKLNIKKNNIFNILIFYKNINIKHLINKNKVFNFKNKNYYYTQIENEFKIIDIFFNDNLKLRKKAGYNIFYKKSIKPFYVKNTNFMLYKYNPGNLSNNLYFFYNFKFFKKFKIIKTSKTISKKTFFFDFNNFKKLLFVSFKNIIYLNDLYEFSDFFKKNNLLFSNEFFKSLLIMGDFNPGKNAFKLFEDNIKKNSNLVNYNNYYPIFYTHKKTYKLFMSKFKFNLNIDYLIYINFYVLSFLEKLFKKRFFLKFSNNYFFKPYNLNLLHKIYDDYKNFKPKYITNSSLKDFFEIIWYSFFLKDLTLLSEWFCKFMESVNFKIHKKFIIFFQNFINKNQTVFFDFLNLKGFFFDIRGKVGVTGNSKKRHHFFKIGKINKSTKIRKINFKQSVIRTPSGALGLTMIINY